MTTIPIGTKVCSKNNSLVEGEIVSEPVDIQGETNYVIRLNKGFYSINSDIYTSVLVIHESNIVLIKDFRND